MCWYELGNFQLQVFQFETHPTETYTTLNCHLVAETGSCSLIKNFFNSRHGVMVVIRDNNLNEVNYLAEYCGPLSKLMLGIITEEQSCFWIRSSEVKDQHLTRNRFWWGLSTEWLILSCKIQIKLFKHQIKAAECPVSTSGRPFLNCQSKTESEITLPDKQKHKSLNYIAPKI